MDLIGRIDNINLVDSWVKNNKLIETKGHGEGKLSIPSKINVDEFFKENKENMYLNRENILNYLKSIMTEYVCNNQIYRNSNTMSDEYFDYLKFYYDNLSRIDLKFEIFIPDIKRRSYINSDSMIYQWLRKIVIPRKTNLDIKKYRSMNDLITYKWIIKYDS